MNIRLFAALLAGAALAACGVDATPQSSGSAGAAAQPAAAEPAAPAAERTTEAEKKAE